MNDRFLTWDGCKNVRDLGGLRTQDGRTTRPGAILRSDTPGRLTPAGWAALYDAGIRTIVTLRTHGMQEPELDYDVPYPDLFRVQAAIEDVTDEDFLRKWAETGLWSTPLYYTDALQRWPQRHAGRGACSSCHTTAEQIHTFQAASPGYKNCGACHTKRHAGRKVAQSRCAQCHKGTSGRPAQHSSTVTKKFVCGGCHSQRLHASAVSKKVKSCRTCHRGKYHAAQRNPGKSACTNCHSIAKRHDNGYPCTLCHRRAVHAPRPSPVNL